MCIGPRLSSSRPSSPLYRGRACLRADRGQRGPARDFPWLGGRRPHQLDPILVELPLDVLGEARADEPRHPADDPVLGPGPASVVPQRHPVVEWVLAGQRRARLILHSLEVLGIVLAEQPAGRLAAGELGGSYFLDHAGRLAFYGTPLPCVRPPGPPWMPKVQPTRGERAARTI